MDITVLVVFLVVYLGMVMGGIPGLALDRTGVAVLGAIVLVATGHIGLAQAWEAVDISTMALLFGLMMVSAQLRLGGFYTQVVRAVAEAPLSPQLLLGGLIGVVGLLSAVLVNDVVCIASTPVIVAACARRKLDPVPFLLGLACASNVGSAATLIGNPQNMLVGQRLGLSFSGYLLDSAVPTVLGLGAIWLVISIAYRGRFFRETAPQNPDLPRFGRWQTTKGLLVVAGLVITFLFTPIPRGVAALAAAGIVLTSRHLRSRLSLGEVDWQLLVLFGGLFVVNHVLVGSGVLQHMVTEIARTGVDMREPVWLFVVTTILSNLVSNVPAVMLLLPVCDHPQAGPILALSSTLAGNLLLVGSIANLIVVDVASRMGVKVSFRQHARVGIPVTILTLAIAAFWLWIRSVA